VLELGAGSGVTAGAIARLGHTVVAVDIVEQAGASARCIAAELPPGALTVVQGDFYEIQLSNSFDVVCYFDGLGMSLLKLWVTLQPNAAEAYEMLGWAYLVQGEKKVAVDTLRRALTLDPEAWHAERLLEQLSR
jgi:SAM-dependent methyltransferase